MPLAAAINTTPGTHRFTVTGDDGARQPLSVTITHTVKGGG